MLFKQNYNTISVHATNWPGIILNEIFTLDHSISECFEIVLSVPKQANLPQCPM